MARNYEDKASAMAPGQIGFNVTPHATDLLANITRFIMVTVDGATVTGYLEGDPSNAHTTAPLSIGAIYPMCFTRITAVSSGAVKGYC